MSRFRELHGLKTAPPPEPKPMVNPPGAIVQVIYGRDGFSAFCTECIECVTPPSTWYRDGARMRTCVTGALYDRLIHMRAKHGEPA